MTRRYHRYLTVQQTSKALNIDVNQVLAMLNNGELRGSSKRPGKAQLISTTAIELARRRLQSLRRLDGDVQ